jgi:hypothetical protein
VILYGGISLAEFLKRNEEIPNSNKSGIYFWVYDNQLIYVGKSESNIWKRNRNHSMLQVSGFYSVKTIKYKTDQKKEYVDEEFNQLGTLEAFQDFAKHAFEYRKRISVYWIIKNELGTFNYSGKKIIKNLEAHLIERFDPEDNLVTPTLDDEGKINIQVLDDIGKTLSILLQGKPGITLTKKAPNNQ